MPHRRVLRSRIPASLLHWLLDPASLTHRVRQACPGCFGVRVVSQGWARPTHDERRRLAMRRGERSLVRHVELQCDGRAWVFARTVIPAHTLTGARRRLARLGTRVHLVSAVGADAFGDQLLAATSAAGVAVERVRRGPHPTGTYTALLDADGALRVDVGNIQNGLLHVAACRAQPRRLTLELLAQQTMLPLLDCQRISMIDGYCRPIDQSVQIGNASAPSSSRYCRGLVCKMIPRRKRSPS